MLLQYADVLCEDLGIQKNRKASWWRELLEPYSATDYKGMVEQWMKQQESSCAPKNL
jgi:hypothetical protein